MAGVFFSHALAFQHQEPQRHERQGHVVMPAHPTPDFIVVQAHFAVAQFEHFFDAMAVIVSPDQFLHRDARGGVAQAVVRFRRGLDGPDHQQPFAR